MRKKVRVLAVSLSLLMMLTACGGGTGSQSFGGSQGGGQTVDIQENLGGAQTVGAQGNSDGGQNGDILGDGQAADEELSPEEVIREREIAGAAAFFKAFQELDAEGVKPYLSENDYEDVSVLFEKIKENEEDVAFWNKTIGTMIYFPDSDVLVRKSWDYIQAKWYTDCWKENAEIPARDAEEFSKEYLDDIYDRYYADAPYCTESKFGETFMYISEETESVTCWEDSFTKALGIESFYILSRMENLRAAIMMESVSVLGLGYEYIAKDIPGYEALLSKDIDQMIAILDEVVDPEERGLYLDTYRNYYKNEETKEVLQQFLDEQCEIYRTLDNITFFLPVDMDRDFYEIWYLTEENKEFLKQMGVRVIHDVRIRKFPERLNNNFTAYYDVVESAKEYDLVE